METITNPDVIRGSIVKFVDWLNRYGEVSYDYQTYYASRLGRKAKQLYYDHRSFGFLAVAPGVFCEAFIPSAKCLFWKKQRFPIADAHFSMGFLFLAQVTGDQQYYERAVHFLNVLEETRSAGYEHYCWGYPFDWQTLSGTLPQGTPLITTVPYVYEAFRQAYQFDGNSKWLAIMESIAEHALNDYKEFPITATASSCSYTPAPEKAPGVINANAYRAFLLTSASVDLSRDKYRAVAQRNLEYVLCSQNPDGSWYYGGEEKRHQFTDHYHTCFVLKALTKIESLTGDLSCSKAVDRGLSYYVANLFDEQHLPKPFSRRPRLTVYQRELYDYAECVNLLTLVRGRSSATDALLGNVVDQTINVWQKRNGCFRGRKLHLGWDNSVMHRWGQSQMFRSLCQLLFQISGVAGRHSQDREMAPAAVAL